MSNSFLIVSVLLVIGTTSCHKKYTCKCTTTDEATGNEISTRDFSYSGKDSRSTAQRNEACTLTAPQVDETYDFPTTTNCVMY